MSPIRIVTLLCIFLLITKVTSATHLRGGEITVNRVNCNSLQYEIILTLYTNTASNAQPGGGRLTFGDNAFITLPDIQNTVIDAATSIGVAVFKVTHIYAKEGTYLLTYTEPNRNAGILNIPNSGVTPFYVETELIISDTFGCNHPLAFSILPIDKGCYGSAFSHNPGAYDTDGDSLSYEITIPKRAANLPVAGFAYPNASAFYTGLSYPISNEDQNGPPTFAINAVTGTLIWDAPGNIGQYEITFKVTEWKKVDGAYVVAGYVVRDMQIIIEDCPNSRPYLKIPKDVCVSPGDHISEVIRGFDDDFDKVKIEVFATDNFYSSPPTIKYANVLESTLAPSDTANVRFNWTISCDQVRDQSYTIIFKVTDQPSSGGVKLSSFYTWTISVIGRPPTYKDFSLDVATKTLRIEWDPYPCTNATSMEVWRRSGEFAYTQESCRRGIPRALGFEKIGTVTNANFFLDKNLSAGAEYCYRLVAVYETPYKSFSIVSVAKCIGPLTIDAPVITNVSVLKTDSLAGQIQVRWTSPFQIDKTDFPPPYEYNVFRTTDGTNYTSAYAQRIKDTVVVDNTVNTLKTSYGYKIVVYSPGGLTKDTPIDTSALAYYPRLTATSRENSIYLFWDATVPWTNQSQKFPWHYIYRQEKGGVFQLIDSIDINQLTIDKGFEYLDQGKFKATALDQNTIYNYKISTEGVYGNPRIKEPLINYSNEVLAQTVDHTPPCTPILQLEANSCSDFLVNTACNVNEFKNTLNIQYPDNCGNDIASFQVLFAANAIADFKLLSETQSLQFIHRKQDSFLGCYTVVAIDRSGNKSISSDTVCSENCPNVFIPNVFTPDNKDGVNDFFPGITTVDITKTDPEKCPRFIKSLDLHIYNRGGQEVYSATINSLLQPDALEWSGHDANGKELPTGIYFFSATIQFDTLDPAQQVQKAKGWVNLVR